MRERSFENLPWVPCDVSFQMTGASPSPAVTLILAAGHNSPKLTNPWCDFGPKMPTCEKPCTPHSPCTVHTHCLVFICLALIL